MLARQGLRLCPIGENRVITNYGPSGQLVLTPSMRMPVYVKREFAILMLFLLLSFLKPTFLS